MRTLVCIGMGAFMLLSVGCGSGYFTDRNRDAADIFTFTTGVGMGATARVGAVHAGLYTGRDASGLKGGEVSWETMQNLDDKWGSTCDLLLGVPTPDGWMFAWEDSRAAQDGDAVAVARGKVYSARGVAPLIMVPSKLGGSRPYYERPDYGPNYPYHYWTQIEVTAGAGPSVRVGFNPGELVDFLVGWFGVDIYDDDIAAAAQKKRRMKEVLPEDWEPFQQGS